ncbi:MAG: DUF3883 domain-containing protein [Nitrosarchaeum sp.]
MVIKLKQIPKLLGIIKKFEKDKNTKPIIAYVAKTFNNSPVEEAIYPDFNELGKFCKDTGILKFENDIIVITSLGNQIFDEYGKSSKLNPKLKKLFREQCFLNGSFSQSVTDSLSRFVKTRNEVWAPSDQVYDLFKDKELLSLLYECELLTLVGDKVILNSEYYDKISTKKITNQVRITQKQIDNQLRLMKKIGEIAEDLVVKYEKNRLNGIGCKFESDKVQRISLGHANAGYDVVSFNDTSKDGDYDRFIEVKGSSGKDFDFHWSENEIKTAIELENKYWIYFVPEINVETMNTESDIEKIQNPYKRIFESASFSKTLENYHIRKTGND